MLLSRRQRLFKLLRRSFSSVSNLNDIRASDTSPKPTVVKHVDCLWNIEASVALIREPIIAPPMTPTEKRFAEICEAMEKEDSYKCDFELRLEKDAVLLEKRRQFEAEGRDLSELDVQLGISSFQLRDDWFRDGEELLQKLDVFNQTQFESLEEHSIRRKLDRKLVLLVRHRFSSTALSKDYVSGWELPKVRNLEGETLRETTDRCLREVVFTPDGLPGLREVEVIGDDGIRSKQKVWDLKIFGNAPLAHLRFKYPQKIQERMGAQGSIVFFFAALLEDRGLTQLGSEKSMKFNEAEIAEFRWSTSEEASEIVANKKSKSIIDTVLLE